MFSSRFLFYIGSLASLRWDSPPTHKGFRPDSSGSTFIPLTAFPSVKTSVKNFKKTQEKNLETGCLWEHYTTSEDRPCSLRGGKSPSLSFQFFLFVIKIYMLFYMFKYYKNLINRLAKNKKID